MTLTRYYVALVCSQHPPGLFFLLMLSCTLFDFVTIIFDLIVYFMNVGNLVMFV